MLDLSLIQDLASLAETGNFSRRVHQWKNVNRVQPGLPLSLRCLRNVDLHMPVVFAAAGQTKAMEQCIEDTIAYASERRAFGRAIIDNQVVQYRLAELQTEIEALRALTYAAVESYIHDEDVTLQASMAKLKAGRLAREVSDACMQYWGGMGYMWDNPVARYYRDGRLTSIGGGADEVMLAIICKKMGIVGSGR